MAERTSYVSVRRCDFCQKFFHGVDTRRSYLRHLRTNHYGLDPEQVRRVVELGRPEETVSYASRETLPNAFSSGLQGSAAGDVRSPEMVAFGGSTLRLSESPVFRRPREELVPIEAPESQPSLPCPSSPAGDDELQDIIDSLLATGPGSSAVVPCPSPLPEDVFPSEPLNLALTMGPKLSDEEEDVAEPLMLNEGKSRVPLGNLNPGCSGTVMMMTAPALPLDPPPVPVSVNAPVLSVPELAPIFAWANRLFPPYDYGQFVADAKRLFPLCSVKMATEVYVNCRLGVTRPGRTLAPLPVVVEISSESEEDFPAEDGWSTQGASPGSVAEELDADDPDAEVSDAENPHDDDPNDEDYVPAETEDEMSSIESPSEDGDSDSPSSAESSHSTSEEEYMVINSDSSE